jgi:hypothetical protein
MANYFNKLFVLLVVSICFLILTSTSTFADQNINKSAKVTTLIRGEI